MSTRLLLRAAVNERLKAAAEEIFLVFERTMAKYEEEASTSKQEIERLRSLLQSNQKTDFSQLLICKEESLTEQHHCELESRFMDCQTQDPEPRHIKEEDRELWVCQQNRGEEEDTEQVPELGDPYLPHSAVCWDKNEQEDSKPHVQPQAQNIESEEPFENQQESETVQFVPPLASASQTLIPNKRVQDGTENQRPATSSAGQTPTDESRSSFIAFRESTELFQFNSVAPEYRCQLCDKIFSSNQHLINHAFRMHSKDADILCAVCGKTLDSTENLSVHLQSHKGSNSCHLCGKQYNSKTALMEHMASHTGVKLHRCQVCGKECSRKGDLKIHMRIHTGEKPFCCSYCLKRFTHSGHLKKHMRSHTGERPHQCYVCGRGFLQSTHLKYHLGTHTQKY